MNREKFLVFNMQIRQIDLDPWMIKIESILGIEV